MFACLYVVCQGCVGFHACKSWFICSSESDDLPEPSVQGFSEWINSKVGQLLLVLDFGAFGAALGVVRSFQAACCDHLKKLGRVNHKLPTLDDVRRAAQD